MSYLGEKTHQQYFIYFLSTKSEIRTNSNHANKKNTEIHSHIHIIKDAFNNYILILLCVCVCVWSISTSALQITGQSSTAQLHLIRQSRLKANQRMKYSHSECIFFRSIAHDHSNPYFQFTQLYFFFYLLASWVCVYGGGSSEANSVSAAHSGQGSVIALLWFLNDII